jgi:hypothetical protein
METEKLFYEANITYKFKILFFIFTVVSSSSLMIANIIVIGDLYNR